MHQVPPPSRCAALAQVPNLDRLRLAPDTSPIAEELNLLYAAHEITSETTTAMLDFFEKGQGMP
jgi:hypothetical protein